MDEMKLALYWEDIPIGRNKAITYDTLAATWRIDKRTVRKILHELSRFDNGDNYVLIRSSHGTGFYKTDNEADIADYRAECLNRGRRTLAPLKKIDRILKPDGGQMNLRNNIKVMRKAAGLSQAEVCAYMRAFDSAFDEPLLSKMENGVCLPTEYQLSELARILRCEPFELVNAHFITMD